MNKFLTRIQSRLYRKGLRISLPDIRLIYNQRVVDLENPADEELDDVVDHFLRQYSKPVPVELVQEEEIQVDPALDELPDDEINIEEAETAIALQEKTDFVAVTAASMGVNLDMEGLSNIAQNVNCSSDDLHSSLDEIKTAIIAYIRHKSEANRLKIHQVINEIRGIAADEFEDNSQQLVEGLQELNSQMQNQSTDFKSKLKFCLDAFALPSTTQSQPIDNQV